MAEDLETALKRVLEGRARLSVSMPPETAEKTDIYKMSGRALEHYEKARVFLQDGNWAEYGKELDQLEKILKEMAVLKE